MKKFTLSIFTIVFALSSVFGQQLPIDNQYIMNKYSLSPAYSGFNHNAEAFVGLRKNWAGIEGAPQKQFINVNSPLSKNSGIGGSIIHESTGNFSHFSGALSYAYHMQLSKEQFISFGLSGEVYRNQIETQKIISQGDDPVIMNNTALKGTTFNTSAGIAFRSQGFHIGAVVPRILETKISYLEGSEYVYTLSREYLVHLSYNFEPNRDFDVEPYAIVRMTANSGIVYEGTVKARYKQKAWLAATYRNDMNIGIHTGFALTNRMVMMYSYEFSTKGIIGVSSGSHEFSLGFLLNRAKRKPGLTIFPMDKEQSAALDFEKKIKSISKRISNDSVKTQQQIAELENKIKDLEEKVKNAPTTTTSPDAKYGTPVKLKNIKFGNNSDKLFSSSYPSLNKLAMMLRKDPKIQILITGHTDNIGSKQYNKRLSLKRATAIKDYLVSRRRIESDRIKVEGKGEEKPIADNKTREGQAINRRIEIRFKKN